VTWDTYTLYAWSSSELFVNIVCGSLPTLKPIYDSWANNRPLVPSKDYKSSGGENSTSGFAFRLYKSSLKQNSGLSSSKSNIAPSSITEMPQYKPLKSSDGIAVSQSFDVESQKLPGISAREVF
jgi:hypothetical protein